MPFAVSLLVLLLVGFALTWHRNRAGFLIIVVSLAITIALVLGTALRHSVNARYLLHLHIFALVLSRSRRCSCSCS